MPPEVLEARILDGLAQRYSCPPSLLRDESIYNLRIATLAILSGADDAGQ